MAKATCPVCGDVFKANYVGRKTCSDVCAGVLRGSFEERFWRRVNDRVEGDACWEWQGRIEKDGYAKIRREDRRRVMVHRASWELVYGPIPDGLLVLHKCDNRKCVRPTHLFLGTYKDNSDDMYAKGRQNDPRGEEHGRAKLTEEQVLQIRQLGVIKVSTKEIAERFGVHWMTIYRILSGKRWKHLQG